MTVFARFCLLLAVILSSFFAESGVCETVNTTFKDVITIAVNHGISTSPDLVQRALTPSPGKQIILRGVAPNEAIQSIALSTSGKIGGGRIRGRDNYAIKDEAVVPGFLMDQHLSANEVELIFLDLEFYANQGAQVEAFKDSNLFNKEIGYDFKSLSHLGQTYFPQARGYLLVFEVAESHRLQHHSESNVSISSMVVDIPLDAKLVGVAKFPDVSVLIEIEKMLHVRTQVNECLTLFE